MKKTTWLITAIVGLASVSQAAIIMTFDTRDDSAGGLTTTANGQTALVAGESPNSGVLDANLEASSLTFGAGTLGSNTSAQRFVTSGFGDGNNPSTVAEALAAGKYLTFIVDAVAGYQADLSTIRLQVAGQNGQDFGWGLYSSADGFASQLGGETALAGSPASYTRTVDVSSIGAQEGPIEFRIAFGAISQWVYVGVGDNGASWPDYGQAIQVDGALSVIPEPATLGLVGIGALMAMAVRRMRM